MFMKPVFIKQELQQACQARKWKIKLANKQNLRSGIKADNL